MKPRHGAAAGTLAIVTAERDRLAQALRDVRSTLELHRHWKPTMPANLIASIDKVLSPTPASALPDPIALALAPFAPAPAPPSASTPPAIEGTAALLPPEFANTLDLLDAAEGGLLDHLFQEVVVGDAETRQAIADEKGGEG